MHKGVNLYEIQFTQARFIESLLYSKRLINSKDTSWVSHLGRYKSAIYIDKDVDEDSPLPSLIPLSLSPFLVPDIKESTYRYCHKVEICK